MSTAALPDWLPLKTCLSRSWVTFRTNTTWKRIFYVRNPDGSLTTDARLPIEELEEQFQLEIERDKFDTVGGLVVHLADGIPVAGTVVIGEDLEIEILEADPRKVKRVKISRLPKATELPTS
jgi:Hemolysins and related proteins containing CBS domains